MYKLEFFWRLAALGGYVAFERRFETVIQNSKSDYRVNDWFGANVPSFRSAQSFLRIPEGKKVLCSDVKEWQ